MRQPAGLLAFDLDGTLVKKHGTQKQRFHPRVLDYLEDLQNSGYLWVIISGRTITSIIRALTNYKIRLDPNFIIAREAEIYSLSESGHWLDFSDWNDVARTDQRQFTRCHRGVFKRLRKKFTNHGAQFFEGEDGQFIAVTTSTSAMDSLCESVEELFDSNPDLGFQRNGTHLRFTHSAYNKGTALQELSRLIEVQPVDVFAAGDNDNDLPMLDNSIAAKIACPANAIDRVKQTVVSANGYVGTAQASVGVMQALDFFYFRNH